MELLIPAETHLIPEVLWEVCVPNMWDIKMAAVMVLIQRLQNRGQMVDQMAHLSSLTDADALSQYTTAALLGTTRESRRSCQGGAWRDGNLSLDASWWKGTVTLPRFDQT